MPLLFRDGMAGFIIPDKDAREWIAYREHKNVEDVKGDYYLTTLHGYTQGQGTQFLPTGFYFDLNKEPTGAWFLPLQLPRRDKGQVVQGAGARRVKKYFADTGYNGILEWIVCPDRRLVS